MKTCAPPLLNERGVPGDGMRVLVAGAGGALGTHVIRHLVADRHEVIGFNRSTAHAEVVQQLGASRSISRDALDPSSIRAALGSTRPEAVIHALTAIPKQGPWRVSDLEQTNELRIRGTKYLLDATIAVGALRLVDDEPASFAEVVRRLGAAIGAPQPRTVPKWFVRLVAPYAAASWLGTKMRVSNGKAKRELQWEPRFPNYRAGLAEFSRTDELLK